MLQCFVRGGIAHLVERLHGMQEVWGSSPHISTTQGRTRIGVCKNDLARAKSFLVVMGWLEKLRLRFEWGNRNCGQ